MEKKLVVITGASSGIGKAIAKRFANLGYPMLLLSRNIDSIDKYENSIAKSVDVTNSEAMKAAISEAEAKFGKVEILINNAGVMALNKIELQNPTEWKQMVDINIMGVLNGISCVVKDMADRNSGTIVNVSSVAGRKTFDDHAVYTGTKFAVHAISESIREELAERSVRVIVIAPGIVKTNLLSSVNNKAVKEGYEQYRDSTVEGGLDADNIADIVQYTCTLPQHVCIREVVVAHTKQKP
ncbi:SDR family oxidoreductase [Rickettsiales bacterium LUAb2]